MRLIPIINHIKSNCSLFEGRVDVAQSLEVLPDDDVKNSLPMAFVYSSDEDSPGNESFGGDYRTNQRFSVILVARNIDMGEKSEPLEDLRDQLKEALNSYQPSLQHKPVGWINGKIITTSRRMVWWVDTFESALYE